MRSLRTALLAGLLGGGAALVAGFSGVVYARAHGLAHEALRSELRYRADTLSGLLEIERSGIEFEVPKEMLAPFQEPGRGAYLAIVDSAGKVVVASPSLTKAGAALPAPGPWAAGVEEFAEILGPAGEPCLLLGASFLVRADGADAPGDEDESPSDAAAWTPPPEEKRRYRIQVALASRDRDQALADLRGFLFLTGGVALLLTFGGGLLVTDLVLRPIRRMTEEAAALTAEDDHRRLGPDTVVTELHALALTLNSAFDRLGAALARQRRFTSDASHELRTPVSVLLANADHLLRRSRTGPEYREGLRRQQRIASRMKEITENLLVLAREDVAEAGVDPKPLRLDGLVRAVCRDFDSLAEGSGLSLRCDAEEAVVALGDSLQLHRAVSNLVSNAVKFTPPGGRIDVRVTAEGGAPAIEVADTGSGIPADQAEAVFERFYRVRHGKDAAEGAGLGLAIVRSIVAAHGGDIAVSNREGGGCLFRIRLPAPPPGTTAPADDAGSASESTVQPGAAAVTAGAVPRPVLTESEGA